MGRQINPNVTALNKAVGRKQYPLKTLNVIKTAESAAGTFTITLSIDADYDADMAQTFNMSKAQHTSFIAQDGIYFPVGSGLGIPPHNDSAALPRICVALRDQQADDRDYLAPHDGYAGPDLSAPSKKLLKKIQHAAQSRPHLSVKAQRLNAILNSVNDLKELQAVYDVADILEHFPDTVTARDLWALQPAASMTKTYTIIPEPALSKAENKPCFSISVRRQQASAPQRLLDENPATNQIHDGEVSTYLCALKAGDTLPVVNIVKPQKAFKAPYEPQRDVVFIAQGNAHERSLSYLHEKQANKATLKQQFILVSGFKTEADIPKNDAFKPLAKDGTLTRIYYALSRDKKAPRAQGHEHFCTGKRATEILDDIDLNALNSPVFYVAGGNAFCAAIESQLQSKLGAKADIRISGSKTRIQKPSTPL
jgi:sulfite reductase alpha subunit-like flavoprotein